VTNQPISFQFFLQNLVIYLEHLKNDYVIFRLDDLTSIISSDEYPTPIQSEQNSEGKIQSLLGAENVMMLIYCSKQIIKSVVLNLNFTNPKLQVNIDDCSFSICENENDLKTDYYRMAMHSPFVTVPWLANNFIAVSENYPGFDGINFVPKISNEMKH
jgi:hypothetical protein